MKRIGLFLNIIILLLAGVGEAIAASGIRDPGIPDNETLQYKIVAGETESYTEMITTRYSESDGREVYRITVNTEEENASIVFLRSNLKPVEYESVKQTKKGKLTTIQMIEFNETATSDTISIFSSYDMLHSLRGFPFQKPREIDIKFIGGSDDNENFRMSIGYVGKETITVNGRQRDCYVLEVNMKISGVMRMLSFLMPETKFWFSTDAPHRLIRYTGMGENGGFGDDPVVMEIVD